MIRSSSSPLATAAGRLCASAARPTQRISTSSIQSLSSQLASSLRISPSSASHPFHTSAAANAKVSRYVKSLRRVQKHFARQLQKPKPEDVDPVLGRANVPFIERMKASLAEPDNLAFGLNSEDAEKLVFGAEYAKLLRLRGLSAFSEGSNISALSATLPSPAAPSSESASAIGDATSAVIGTSTSSPSPSNSALTSILQTNSKEDSSKREAMLRIISMQNSALESRKQYAIDFAVKEFARFDGDTGSSEVQAAVATIKIHFLVTHLKEHKKDLRSKRMLQQLVTDRQGILKYLRRAKPERYYWAIEKLGLNDAAIINEFNLSGRYFEKYQFFGPNTLAIRDSKKERKAKIKYSRMEKKAQKFLSVTAGSK